VKRPTASIVIPTHDRPVLVRRAVASALGQSLADIEVIVVDDGSAQPFRLDDDDPRVRIIRHDRARGVCAARNAGLGASNADWVTFLDDDDELLPWMVETCLREAAASQLPPPVAVLSARRDVDDQGRTVATQVPVTLSRGRRYFLEDVPTGSFKTENTLFAPVGVMRQIGGWDEDIMAGWEHDDLFLRLNSCCSLQGSPVVTYVWHDHAGPRRHRAMLDSAEGMARTFEKHQATFALYPQRSARYLATMGVWYLNAGYWRRALASTTRGLLLDPTRSRLWLWWFASVTGPAGLAMYRAGRRALDGRYRRSHARRRSFAAWSSNPGAAHGPVASNEERG
jgi:glycosyltransferase involved in cell wall biosynthesis